MSAAECPACGAAPLRADFATPRLSVQRCPSCGHRVAEHSAPAPAADYHEQYGEGCFLETLRATRVRQARLMLRWIRAAAPSARQLFDFGCGRGWLLDEARAAGFEVCGADTSAVAVRLLQERGIRGIALDPAHRGLPDGMAPPQVLTALDVIEHLPAAELLERVSALRAGLLVLKVPSSSGLLYRAARVLRALGAPSAIERLYQVGTAPPHYHYFSARSLRALLRRARLRLVSLERDRDFEPAELSQRARLPLPAPLVKVAARAIAAAAPVLAMEDSLIALARGA